MYNGQRLFIPVTLITSLVISFSLFLITSGNIFQSVGNNSNQNPLQISQPEYMESRAGGSGSITFHISSARNELMDCHLSQSYPEQIQQWCMLIERYANLHGFDPNLIAAVIMQESAGEPGAYSHSGAVGLMQVMPRDGLAASFICANGPCFEDRPSIKELQEPEFNIAFGTQMLANLNNKHGSIREALKYYGPMDVGYYYTDKVLAIYERSSS